jgi:hypothetical protein
MNTLRKEPTEKEFDPEKYGMVICPQCIGLGRFRNEAKDASVCKVCGGFGAIKSLTEEVIEKE